MPMVVATNIINKKTYLMTFIAWAILLTDVIFGTFLDVLGKPLNSSFGVILFITMSITVFFAGLYALRDFMVALRKDLEASSFFNRLYKATPIFLYALLVVFGAITVQMVLFSHYSTYLLLLIVLISGVAILFFGFRTYKFLSWFKSSSNKRHNIMILAFAVSSLLFGISVTTTTILDTKVFLSARPASIDPDYQSSNDIGSRQLSRIELMIHLYIYIVPVVLAIPAETVAVAYFLRYFRDQIGRATFWTLVILPPLLNIFGIFGPQLLTTGSEFVYAESRFLIFRIIGTAGWVGADFVIAFAYLLVAKTLGRQTTSSSHTKKIINYLIIAALSTILVSPTANNWITNTSYPPFGAIQRAFDVLASFLFSIGIYSVGLSLAQDSKLRHLARKYAKEYSLLDTLGNAQLDAEVTRKFVKLIHEQAGAMKKETGVEPLTDDNEIRQYLELVIRETREKKKDDRTVGR